MRRARAIVGALAAALLLAGSTGAAAADDATESVQVEPGPVGQALAPGYVSFSFEYRALHQYTGRDPDAINPVLLALLRQLDPTGGAVLRIGGDSSDQTWWPQPGVIAPGGVNYALSRGWARVAAALAAETGDRLLLGINLAAGRPAVAATEARSLLAALGRRRIAGFEIGNEPDLYSSAAWFRDHHRHAVSARPPGYGLPQLIHEWRRWRGALPTGIGVAGPSLATLAWGPGLERFLRAEPHLTAMTLHRYPLRGCADDPVAPNFASIDHLLSPSASVGMAESLAPYVALAHAHGEPFRLDELNSASCGGRLGVSDTFASALWLTDTLYALAAAGVDGVNLHTLPGAAYQPFSFARTGRDWEGIVTPVFYGALLFGRGFPAGARLLPVASSSSAVSVWATQDPAGRLRVTLINKSPVPVDVSLSLPHGSSPELSTEGLNAPSPGSMSDINLSGQHFERPTSTGALAGQLALGSVTASSGRFALRIDPYSALLLSS